MSASIFARDMQIWPCDTVTSCFIYDGFRKLKRTIPAVSASSVVILHLSKVSGFFFSLLIFLLLQNLCHCFCSDVDTSQTFCMTRTEAYTAVLSFFHCPAHYRKCTYNDAALIYGLQSGCELQHKQSWRCLKLSRSALIWVYVPVALVLINIQRGYITAQPTPRPLRAWREREPSGCGKWEVGKKIKIKKERNRIKNSAHQRECGKKKLQWSRNRKFYVNLEQADFWMSNRRNHKAELYFIWGGGGAFHLALSRPVV